MHPCLAHVAGRAVGVGWVGVLWLEAQSGSSCITAYCAKAALCGAAVGCLQHVREVGRQQQLVNPGLRPVLSIKALGLQVLFHEVSQHCTRAEREGRRA